MNESLENQNLNSVVESQNLETNDTINEEVSNLAPLETSSNQEDGTPKTTTEENQTEETGEIPADQVQEEKKEETAEERILRLENNLKSATGKISGLEKERNSYSLKEKETREIATEAISYIDRLSDNATALDTAAELVANPKKFESLKPFLASKFPQLASLTYDEFSGQINTALTNQAQTDPKNYQSIQKIENAKQQSQFQQQLETQKIITNIKFDVLRELPEFESLHYQNEALAEQDFDYAFSIAQNRFALEKSRGNEPDRNQIRQFVIDGLKSIHPEFSQRKTAIKQSNQALENDVKGILKGSSTTSSQASTATPDVSKLPEIHQKAFTARMKTYQERGDNDETAKKKAWQFINEL